jgi:DNA polymerase-1
MEEHQDLVEPFIATVHRAAARCNWHVAHNIKFDMHMLANIDLPYKEDNVLDTMILIRLAHDALHPAEGGPPLNLKQYVKKYIDKRGGAEEKKLKSQQSSIAKEYNRKLKDRLSAFKTPEGKSWGLGYLNEFFKSPLATLDDFPSNELKYAYLDWYNKIPQDIRDKMTGMLVSRDDIPYTYLDRGLIIPYAMKDVVYVLQVYEKTMPVIKVRKQTKGLEIEQKLIKPLFEMERVGFDIDKDYLEDSEAKVKAYIIQQHEKFNSLAGEELSVGQHQRIKEILSQKYKLNLRSTNDGVLSKVMADLPQDNPAVEFIKLLQELRTLYKWYSTYIIRFLNELKLSSRLYTQINQVGAVSGRVTSDFQQFPKHAITKENGEELFHPRKIVKASEQHPIVYLDYSQIELRLQAMYTILVEHPDLNMCRAYMPYKCYSKETKETFDYENPNHVARWNSGEWLHEEDDKHWDPVDVHGATTKEAFDITEDHPDFKSLRSIGKRINFAKNYGAQYNRIAQMFPERSPEEIKKIDSAYYKAFPGVKKYHD